MSSLLRSLVEDPAPTLVLEVSTDGIVAVRRNNGSGARLRAERSFAPGTIDPVPTRPNIVHAGEFAAALGAALDELGPRNGAETALILPDASSRITVLDFDELPSGAEERLKLIRSRLAKSVPFDIAAARIAYQASSSARGHSVLVALTPAEVVRQYEDALAQFGLWSGFVSVSSAAALNLLTDGDMILFVKLAPSGLMTLAAIENGVVRLVRSVDLGSLEARPPEQLLNDMLADIFPTQVFVSDSLGQSVDQLVLCGFGEYLAPALELFPKELGCGAKPLESSDGPVGRRDAGMWGYLSLS
jgi:type IV pilus assembly protein PilM